jgi:putative membrane protein
MALDSTQLAVDRTRMAHDRTLMAWVRTATSLISFGFAIDKFFEGGPRAEHAILGARNFSLVMISIGLATLVLATLQHHKDLKELERDAGKQPFSVALILAVLIAALGILGLLSILI